MPRMNFLIDTQLKGEDEDMYEKPELTQVGDARDTILGVVAGGMDFDTTFLFYPDGFAAESIEEE